MIISRHLVCENKLNIARSSSGNVNLKSIQSEIMNNPQKLKEYFGEVFISPYWKYKGVNNQINTDDEDNETPISLGLVFYDTKKNITIKLTYRLESERYYLTERNEQGRYSTKCDFMKKELPQFNQFIQSNY